MPKVTMFQPITYKVGKAINLVEYDEDIGVLGPRSLISEDELFSAYKEHAESFSTFRQARDSAIKLADFMRSLEVKATGYIFMEVECPIFEMQGAEILSIHFQGRRIQEETPLNTSSGCCTLF